MYTFIAEKSAYPDKPKKGSKVDLVHRCFATELWVVKKWAKQH